jgi:hypothetical protein
MIRTTQAVIENGHWRDVPTGNPADASSCQLVLVFGAREAFEAPGTRNAVEQRYPNAVIAYATTAGEIVGGEVLDGTAVVTGLEFQRTRVHAVATHITEHRGSAECGVHLMRGLPTEDLAAVLVFSDGGLVNGSELVRGLNSENHRKVPITGGLAGDADRFERTLCGLNDRVEAGLVVAIGLYSNALHVGHGSHGGWDEFGPERMVTYAESNVLFKIDDRSALSLYKEYLGPYADELPGSALLFPLSLRIDGSDHKLVRTILSVNDENDSMTFAGDMPYGARVRLMKANFDSLVDAATISASSCTKAMGGVQPEFALIVSCVGRKLVLRGRVDEEVEAARTVIGDAACITGFYSYGELSPFKPNAGCDLHNQTMTITTFTED